MEPGCGRVDGGNNGGRGIGEAHEVDEECGTLAAGERGGLVVAASDGLECEGVVLLGPGGELAVDADLGSQDAVESTCGAEGCLTAKRGWNEGERRCAGGGGGHDLGRVGDCVVVEGDSVVVAALERPDLGPVAVRELRVEKVAHALKHTGAVAFGVRWWS